jgi:hypothetical protein
MDNRTLEEAAQDYLCEFEIIDDKIIKEWNNSEFTLDDIEEAFQDGFKFARDTSEPLHICRFECDPTDPDAQDSEEMVLLNKNQKNYPLSFDKYMVCVFGAEHKNQIPHIHIIIPDVLNIAYHTDNSIMEVIEGDSSVLKSLTKEVVAWFDLPNKIFGTNRDECEYQYHIQNSDKLIIHKPH